MADCTDLRIIRIYDFHLIPKHLIEQVGGSEVNIENVMQFGDKVASSPLTLLYAFADPDNKVVGYIWANVDVFDEVVHVNALSIDKEYQDAKGTAIRMALDFLKGVVETTKLKQKLTFSTTRPKAFEKYGFAITPLINMEMVFNKDSDNGKKER